MTVTNHDGAIAGTRRSQRMTIEQHEQLAPLLTALYHGLLRIGGDRYPKNCAPARRRGRLLNAVITLKSRLDDAWLQAGGYDNHVTIAFTGFIYYSPPELVALGDAIIADNATMPAAEFAAWLHVLSDEITQHVNGYRPVAIIDAARKVERSLYHLSDDYSEARPRREYLKQERAALVA